MNKSLFPLGRIVATPGALETLATLGVLSVTLIARHHTGDWGNLDSSDKRANEDAIKHDARILSAYIIEGHKFYVITEADRSSTCLLLADEY